MIGRIDDMLIVRGVNLFPSSIENIVRRFDGVDEFVVEVYRDREMDEMEIRIESSLSDPAPLVRGIQNEVHLGLGSGPGSRSPRPGRSRASS